MNVRLNLFYDLKFKTKLIKQPELVKNREEKDKYDEASRYLLKQLGAYITIGECIDVLLKERKESNNW